MPFSASGCVRGLCETRCQNFEKAVSLLPFFFPSELLFCFIFSLVLLVSSQFAVVKKFLSRFAAFFFFSFHFVIIDGFLHENSTRTCSNNSRILMNQVDCGEYLSWTKRSSVRRGFYFSRLNETVELFFMPVKMSSAFVYSLFACSSYQSRHSPESRFYE